MRARICVIAAVALVKMMLASDVPTATSVGVLPPDTSPSSACVWSNNRINAGTMMTPPPMPSMPPKRPDTTPVARQTMVKTRSSK